MTLKFDALRIVKFVDKLNGFLSNGSTYGLRMGDIVTGTMIIKYKIITQNITLSVAFYVYDVSVTFAFKMHR